MSQTFKSCPKCATIQPHEAKYCVNCGYDYLVNELRSITYKDIKGILRETEYTNMLLKQLVIVQEKQLDMMEKLYEMAYRGSAALRK